MYSNHYSVIYQIILALWIPFAAAIFNISNFRSKGHFSGFKGQFTATSENPTFYPYFMVKTMVSGEDFPLKTNPIFAFKNISKKNKAIGFLMVSSRFFISPQ
jgi:hypothetical protein